MKVNPLPIYQNLIILIFLLQEATKNKPLNKLKKKSKL